MNEAITIQYWLLKIYNNALIIGINTRNWVNSTQDRDYWRGFVNAGNEFSVSISYEVSYGNKSMVGDNVLASRPNIRGLRFGWDCWVLLGCKSAENKCYGCNFKFQIYTFSEEEEEEEEGEEKNKFLLFKMQGRISYIFKYPCFLTNGR